MTQLWPPTRFDVDTGLLPTITPELRGWLHEVSPGKEICLTLPEREADGRSVPLVCTSTLRKLR
jgi:hypothetical protein